MPFTNHSPSAEWLDPALLGSTLRRTFLFGSSLRLKTLRQAIIHAARISAPVLRFPALLDSVVLLASEVAASTREEALPTSTACAWPPTDYAREILYQTWPD